MLHEATHRIPGVPEHVDQPAGHHGTTDHGKVSAHSAPDHGHHHSPARPPRFMVAWQRRVAAFFGQRV
jgi:hypothetical protein